MMASDWQLARAREQLTHSCPWVAEDQLGGVARNFCTSDLAASIEALEAVRLELAGTTGVIERVFLHLNAFELVDDRAFLDWKDDSPSKRDAIVQLSRFYNWLAEQQAEDAADSGDDAADRADTSAAGDGNVE